MNKETVLKIYEKQIEIQKFLESKGFVGSPNFPSSKLREQLKKGRMRLDKLEVRVTRGNYYIECGTPTRKDLEVYTTRVKLGFLIKGDLNVMKKFFELLMSIDKKEVSLECFNNCRLELWRQLNNSPEIKRRFKFQIQFDDEFTFEFPFYVLFCVEEVDMEFNISKEQLVGATKI